MCVLLDGIHVFTGSVDLMLARVIFDMIQVRWLAWDDEGTASNVCAQVQLPRHEGFRSERVLKDEFCLKLKSPEGKVTREWQPTSMNSRFWMWSLMPPPHLYKAPRFVAAAPQRS